MIVTNGPKCKLCRREGEKLFLKGERCYLDKCAMEKRPYPPGQHGEGKKRRKSGSDYNLQLREKQKIKRIYGLQEKQFRTYFKHAAAQSGVTGDNLMRFLELRLDNIVYRMGLAASRKAARQLVRHSHFSLNGKKIDIPSYQVKENDEISVTVKSKEVDAIHSALKSGRTEGLDWLTVDKVKLSGKVLALPERSQIPTPVVEQLVVELYSK